MIHGIAPDARCPYGMSFKLQRPVYGCRSNTRKSRLQFSHFLPMNRYFHVISALILVVNNSRALGLFELNSMQRYGQKKKRPNDMERFGSVLVMFW